MSQLLTVLRQAGFSELACQFASYIQRIDNSDDELVPLTAGLLTEAVAQGHVCLNLLRIDSWTQKVMTLLPEQHEEWLARLQKSNVVGVDGDYKPLILDNNGQLYLYRHWQDEKSVANAILQRSQHIELNDSDALQADFAKWPSSVDGIDWQKVAVLMAMTRQFCVISGGPGTGKTTIVLRILQSLKHQHNGVRIALAAPTGKAAARLQQSVAQADDNGIQAKTLHRLLGITPDNDQGRYNASRPLPFDVVVVDEASMIDISLMAKLLKALSAKARLILLGDSQQLASVESGAVLANLCQQQMIFDQTFSQQLQLLAGQTLDEQFVSDTGSVLTNSVVQLQHSYRFAHDSVIGQLAKSVQTKNSDDIIADFTQLKETVWQSADAANIATQIMAGYQAYFDTVMSSVSPEQCLQAFDQFRVLCALKQGPQSVTSVNNMIERHLNKQGWRSLQDFYHGRPIMVTRNDYRQQLFNGDIGIILYDPKRVLRAHFMIDNEVREIPIARLPAHETAYAMTVHKSQGSEFEQVCVLLPDEEATILTRELLYTALTRAKNQLMIMADESIIRSTVANQHTRETGLADILLA
ncbi:exodeoxyribonuclease V subunit alpha [Methylophaga sp. 41_12_T18]|nr:exodeoxyribonuclease V subunit alpha [Methylophaga sp. 41_12_T18]